MPRYQFIDGEKANRAIDLLCDVMEASRSGYYHWRMRVGFNNPAEALTWAYAAVSYSLIRPPRIFVRVIRWAGNGMTFGSSRDARRYSPWP